MAAAGDPRGRWDADALRDIVRDYVVETLSADDAVLVIDEAGFLKDIFDRYLRLGNMRQLHKELLSSGIVKPDRTTATGRAYGSAPGWIVAPCAAGTRSLSTGTSRSAISCWDELLSRRADVAARAIYGPAAPDGPKGPFLLSRHVRWPKTSGRRNEKRYWPIRPGRIRRHLGELTAIPRRFPVPMTRDNGALPRHL